MLVAEVEVHRRSRRLCTRSSGTVSQDRMSSMRRRSMLTQERKTLVQASLVSPYTLLTKHGECQAENRSR